MQKKFDVIIIGGGVVGSMIARRLSRFQWDVLLIEKGADVGVGSSSANTAIVHAGYDPLPGSLKARLNVLGNTMFDQLAGELNFAFDRRGDYVVAIGDEEFAELEKLMVQGKKNGVPGMSILPGAEVRRREKHITPNVSGAVWASTGGICDPFQITVAAIENAINNGVTVMLETEFQDFIFEGKRIVGVKTNRGDIGCTWAINCAGMYSDFVMHKAGIRPDFKITPRRGEYFILDRAEISIDNVLFPTPTEKGKGILVTTTVHGNTVIGPNALIIDDKEDRSVTTAGMDEIWEGAMKLIPSLKKSHIIATFAGIRSYGNGPSRDPSLNYNHDFIIEIPEEVQGFVNLGGIESPGLTSSPAIALEVEDMLRDAKALPAEKRDWDPIRLARPRFREMSHQERQLIVERDPAYGRVICRCENITEGEIIAEIHAPLPARNYDAIKRRTWCGTGRCQAGFDTPRVVAILAKELGVSPIDITKKGPGSEFLFRKTKEVEG